jgi:signal peptidase II
MNCELFHKLRTASPRRLPWLLLLSAAIFAADRAAKAWVVGHIPYGGGIPVLPPVFALSHWTNEGAAFSMFADTATPVLVNRVLIALNLLVALGVLAAMIHFGQRFSRMTAAFALVLGGALGNIHDRIAYHSVIDFIEVHIFSYHYPDFNIADSAIVTGACLLMLDTLLTREPAKPDSTKEAQ